MKNAYVLDDHFGDDGYVVAGMILTDVSNKRFGELEQRGLVREAKAEEVKAGYQPAIIRDHVGSEQAMLSLVDDRIDSLTAELDDLRKAHEGQLEKLKRDYEAVLQTLRIDCDSALNSAKLQVEDLSLQLATANQQIVELNEQIEAATAPAGEQEPSGDDVEQEKAAPVPHNKQAPKPANKGA